jgi:hypothetical protein
MSASTRGVLAILKQSLSIPAGPMDLASMAKGFETDTAPGEIDTLTWLGHIPGYRRRSEKNQNADIVPQKLDVRVEDFNVSWRLAGTQVRNSKIGPIITDKAQEWARRRIDLMNQLVADRINAAESAVAYDGKSFFATDHSVNKSGTINNDITSPAVSTSAPTLLELANAVLAGLTKFYSFKDDQGLPLYRPQTIVDVVVNTDLIGKVAAAIGLGQIDSGAGSVDNPLLGLTRSMGIQLRPKTSPLLTQGGTKIHLYNASPGCAAYLLGENPAEKRITELDENSDFYKKTGDYEFNGFWAGASAYGEFTDAVLVTLV